MKKTHIIIAAIAAVLCLQAVSFGQQQISESKRKLIAELIEVMDLEKSSKQIQDSVMDSQERLIMKIFDETLQGNDLNDEMRNRTNTILKASTKRTMEKMKTRMAELNWDKFYDDLLYKVYDKYFTEEDLQIMVDFYRSETGKKMLANQVNIFSDTMGEMEEKMMPQLIKIITEISDEETKLLRQDLEKALSSQ